MRVFFSTLLIVLLVFQAARFAAPGGPCRMVEMDLYSCSGTAASCDGERFAAPCCCAFRPHPEQPDEYEATEVANTHRVMPVTLVPSIEKDPGRSTFLPSKPRSIPADTGSSPALYLLKNSYLI